MTTTTITNVRVFDGAALSDPTSVRIDDTRIGEVGGEPSGTVVDGRVGALLPGLIDTHVHVESAADLAALVGHGITTALDMANQDPRVTAGLKDRAGHPHLLGAGLPASAPGGAHTRRMGFPIESAVAGPDDAARFVADRVRDGADHVKIIVEDPRMPGAASLPQDTVAAIVTAAHAAGLLTVAHAVTSTSVRIAADAGVDVITHAPLDRPLTAAEAEALASRGGALLPTLTMLQGTARTVTARPVFRLLRALRVAPPVEYVNARATVAAALAAGVPILAGTDANREPAAPSHPPFGSSLHDELELLVDAGLSPAQAIDAATAAPARIFGLDDRGVVEPGRRADLLLVDGDPTAEIAATRAIAGVWVDGERTR